MLIAGKGHETYQEIAGERMPFSDADEARRPRSRGWQRMMDLAEPPPRVGADVIGRDVRVHARDDRQPRARGGRLCSSRSHGERFDGHDIVGAARESGAAAALVARVGGRAGQLPGCR